MPSHIICFLHQAAASRRPATVGAGLYTDSVIQTTLIPK